MNFTQARMVVRNASSGYTADEIRKAAACVLGTLGATEEDRLDAGSALGYADQIGRRVGYAAGAHCSDLDHHPFSGAVSSGDY